MKVPPYGKVSLCLGHNHLKTQVVLPSTHHSGLDGQIVTKGNEQSKGSWMIGLMGNRA